MAFLETPRFPDDIARGAAGGPEYNTDVVVINSGFEQRNVNWLIARAVYDVAHGIKNQAQLDTLIAFFRTAQGRANGFRFKDWTDYRVSIANGILGAGVGAGLPTYQLTKKYTTGAVSELRAIKKPIAGALIYRNAVLQGSATVDITTGIVTIPATVTRNITAITKANPGVVTSNAHGFTNGQIVYIAGVNGMTQVNSLAFTVGGVTTDTFTLGVNTTAYGTYTSGGTASLYSQPVDVLTWAGEFDVPCRFDTDRMQLSVDFYNLYTWGQIPIVEIRQ